jgi:hypothetical protein
MRARFEITLLHCAAMLCPIVSEHPCYGNVVQVLRHNLGREEMFDHETVQRIADCLCAIARDVPVANISFIASFWPLEGIGLQIMQLSAVRICHFLLGIEMEAKGFLHVINATARLCKSTREEDLQVANVIVGLVEKASVAAMKLQIADREFIIEIVKALKSVIVVGRGVTETLLKERLHIVRVQLDNLREMVFGQDDIDEWQF